MTHRLPVFARLSARLSVRSWAGTLCRPLAQAFTVSLWGLTCLLAMPVQAQGTAAFELVTADEARQAAVADGLAPGGSRTRSMPIVKPGQPAIRVVSPGAAGTVVKAPVRIEVAFTPAPGTRIVPSTFRVLYGLMKLDLTDRLRPHATVSEEGVVVERAQVPDGQHRLILQVADDQGNTAEHELRFRVGDAS